jgi:hypothetical protein
VWLLYIKIPVKGYWRQNWELCFRICPLHVAARILTPKRNLDSHVSLPPFPYRLQISLKVHYYQICWKCLYDSIMGLDGFVSSNKKKQLSSSCSRQVLESTRYLR